jgi:hypothetical protein
MSRYGLSPCPPCNDPRASARGMGCAVPRIFLFSSLPSVRDNNLYVRSALDASRAPCSDMPFTSISEALIRTCVV